MADTAATVRPHRNTRRHIPWWLILGTGVASTAVIVGTFAAVGTGEQGLALATRYTVRVSFPLFLLAYVASAWIRLAPSDASRWALRNRRYIGLSFALAHFIHLGMIVSYFALTPAEPEAIVVALGGLAYAFIALMALTSNDRSVKALGRNWTRLHTVGIHYVWLIFVLTYAPRLAEPEKLWIGVFGTGFAVAALGIRLAARFKPRGARPAAA